MAAPSLVMPNGRPRNRMLANLPADVYDVLEPHFTPASLPQKEILYEYNAPISAVWFPDTAVVSWISEGEKGELVEVATCGYEGFVGVPLFLGVDSTPGRSIVQINGNALGMSASMFQEFCSPPGPFRDVLGRYTQALFNTMAQTAVCNRLHPINERCARWLLLTHDRVGGDTFPLTQEFLAQMLGVRRPTVSLAAGALQQAGLIRYQRGSITVVDREGLEAACCSCYGIVRDTFEELLGIPTG